MTVLYLVALWLFAAKVSIDLEAFTPTSPRRVDLFAFFLIGLVALIFAFALGAGPIVGVTVPCQSCPTVL